MMRSQKNVKFSIDIFAVLSGLEMQVTQVSDIFPYNSSFLFYWHCDCKGSCSNVT